MSTGWARGTAVGERFFRPSGAARRKPPSPGLTPGATFCRRSAAGIRWRGLFQTGFKKVPSKKRHRAAAAHFDPPKPSYRREFIVGLNAVIRAETRERRLGETLAALAAGKKWIDRQPPSATE